ncbi:unnamed protein product [Phytophthora lilii]|uniref:Unnamed protein product n=1 Tax=Phytophthora lilii TaxID=2077276 RepID=A0A9W6X606_9STRA|nr:unnamed protein product [Phytophthora lilii]
MVKSLKKFVPPLLRLVMLVGLYSLDVVDLYGKVFWIGPADSFSFKVVQEQSFLEKPLPRPVFLSSNESTVELGGELLRASGWTSFYDKCSELYATENEENFHMIKAIDCNLRAISSDPHIVHEIVLSATLRADSVAWVSCQLLFFHRRPPLCQENVVTKFTQRYQWMEKEVDNDKMVPINSLAEAELLKMLSLLSRSYPLSHVVCAQGFESTAGPGYYVADVFACGSPNIFESVFVGTSATSFAELHEDLSWLAVDKINIMGFELVTRQNSHSQFVLREKAGKIVAVEESTINFSTFGHLYIALITVDVALLLANARAAFDTSRTFGCSTLLGFEWTGENVKCSDWSWLMLYRSLYRSDSIVSLTVFSGVISWLVDFPFALMWCSEAEGKAYAVLPAVRTWMLVLCLLNLLWSLFARLREGRAYTVAKYTFVTLLEVFVTSAFAIALETNTLFGVAELRRQLEGQRLMDNAAFPDRFAVANAYNEDIDGFATTSPQVVHELFAPLVKVVGESVVYILLVLILKALYNRHQLLQHERELSGSIAVVDFDNIDQHLAEEAIEQRSSNAPLLTRRRARLYHRLPLEELLRTPARAKSIVRCCFDIDEVEDDGLTYMLPHIYYDFGVVVSDAGFLRTRRGFSTVIHRRLDVERFFAPTEKISSVAPSPLKRQRVGDGRATGRAKFALNSVPSPVDAIATVQGSPSPPRTRSEFRPTPMSRSMRRRKSMENLLEGASPKL